MKYACFSSTVCPAPANYPDDGVTLIGAIVMIIEYYHTATSADNYGGQGTGGRDFATYPAGFPGLFFSCMLRLHVEDITDTTSSYYWGNTVDGSSTELSFIIGGIILKLERQYPCWWVLVMMPLVREPTVYSLMMTHLWSRVIHIVIPR